ncbi:ATP-grasp ribosomal peptide maturase, SAV_5884 family [Saccharopolyspora antimicrobica]|uniref:ATP-grasp ribosomal peptide maturase n=1 Tax=Saccharopolyspora antimicrobica TaxID=455193 RepID=A0A1I5IAI5_9PSEU|nr:ATP-grasp ribosomal peptide maturase [Saccharopolyspora antimicrobica]RKT85588.1 ATP-grasp ribosomal peptide maturase [Saccharopolyspora antimicrobica]SFO57230.1 ATP-grasp ribosomal peptide maturase, SAV_5884 family [Saccharopolyspora antimicrobica]
MTVVIFADEADAPVDAVVRTLTRRGVPVFRADTSWFPDRLVLDAELRASRWVGSLTTEHRSVALEDIRSIWYCSPTPFRFPPGMAPQWRTHAAREAKFGFGGVLSALPVLWVNHPNRAADAMYKPLQLVTAAACGLTVPDTLVTNAPTAVRRFAETVETGVVQKSFAANILTEDDKLKIAFTRRLDEAALADLDGIGLTAHQIQQWVDKDYEARVVVVGERVFTIAIHAHSPAARVDWRADFDALRYEWIPTPAEVRRGVRAYMDALGLAYAAFDFSVNRAGCWVFLESNGAGRYGWLENQTGAPITEALADLLQAGMEGMTRDRLEAEGVQPRR